ncbi:hypothetical protein M408DRAFT_30636 [Serendipita vermifera MAFF 305830]|uniref:Cullin family profile domain-containing protein n=1 Tax=Serendipita vermifera MAFF 305830 TaxID=933852 RepID=A0A0C2WRA9_SERVB|nr:hypothetical protein M408DRAFT_30636 [Serendipita vermifera MAFF 305830]
MDTTAEAPMPPKGVDHETMWTGLEKGLDHVMNRLDTGISWSEYMTIGDFVYNYCTTYRNPDLSRGGMEAADSVATDLYNRLIHYFGNHLAKLRAPSESLVDESLLQYYAREWTRYTASATLVHKLFSYLNRHWILRERLSKRKDVYPVYTDRQTKLSSAILKLIESERNGQTINQGLIQNGLKSFVSLGLNEGDTDRISFEVYNEYFQIPFLAATEKYYKAKADAFLGQHTVSDYLKRADQWLREEDDRIERYLDSSTRKILIPKCEHILIQEYSQKILEEFQHLLDYDKDKDLQSMCAILARIPACLISLHERFEAHVTRSGQQVILELVDKGGANIDSLEPKVYLDALSEVCLRNQNIVRRTFKDEIGFINAFEKACKAFMNRNAVTSASNTTFSEFLVNHIDALLRQNSRLVEGSLEIALSQVMVLFKYTEDKDAFQTSYAIKLSNRLIQDLSASEEAEASMISHLKDACGFTCTIKFQRMLTDISLSKDITHEFNESNKQTGNGTGGDTNFKIMVLGSNFWPLKAPSYGFVIPQEIVPIYERFLRFYQSKHTNRRLRWLWNYSKNELRTKYLNRNYVLVTSARQMAILIQYNTSDTFSIDELTASTGITKELLARILDVLVKTDILISDERDWYSLNLNFKSKKTRLDISLLSEAEFKPETVDILKVVDEDRKYVVQATILRIMKARRTSKHQALVAEVVSQLSQRCIPKVDVIKYAIEMLLEKKYMKRAEDVQIPSLSGSWMETQHNLFYFFLVQVLDV